MNRRLAMMVFCTGWAACPAQIQLSPNAPVTIAPPGTAGAAFTVTNVTGFEAIGLASALDYSLNVSGVLSSQPGNATEFVIRRNNIANTGGNFGTVAQVGGGSQPAVLELVTPQMVAEGALVSTSLAAGHVLKLLSVVLTSGTRELLVTGDASLRWYLFDPGTESLWRQRSDRLAEGQVGTQGLTLSVAAGTYALVVAREGGVSTVDLPFSARLGSTTTHLNLSGPGSSVVGITNGSRQFTAVPAIGRWNGVGTPGFDFFSGLSSNLFIGGAQQAASNAPGFVVANGRIGAIAPGDGLFSFTAVQQGQTTSLHQAGVQLLSVGNPGTKSWATSDFLHIFEFEVLAGGFYDLNVTGPTGLGSQAFDPGSSPAWRSRSSGIPGLFSNATQSLVQLTPGWHAIAVFKTATSSAPSGVVTCSVSPSPNHPVPVLNAISPAAAAVGAPTFTLTANGAQFVNGSSVLRWNGTPQQTTFVSAGQLTADISATLLAVGGTAGVTVFTGGPGGGTSGVRSFSILSAAPTLTSLSPASALAGNTAFTMNLNGTGFHPATTVFWNGAILTPSFVSASQLTINVSAGLISVPGSADVRVFNSAPGGGLSQGLVFSILGPTISSLIPSSIPVLTTSSAPVNILISGTGFLPTTQAFADSSPLPTVPFGTTLLQVSVGPTVLGALRRGAVAIAVQNGQAAPSNAIALPVGGGSNQGTIVRHPLNPNLGQVYAAEIENGVPNAPFLLIVDVLNPVPVFPFPDASANFVLSVRPFGIGQPNWLLLTDSIGVFGPPFGPNLDASGKTLLAGFAAPNPALGVSLTLQGAFLDPTSVSGYRITWPRFPDSL